MGLQKNVASQKIAVYAHDTANDVPKTGDAANITAQISKDFGTPAATNDTNPTELDATDHPGIYVFDLTQAETNAENVLLSAVSSTADILLDPVQVFTTPPNFTTLTIANNATNANATHWGGTAVASANVLIDGAITAAKIASDAITAAKIQDGALTAAKFAAGAFDAVWTVAARTLTAATNITAAIADAVWTEVLSAHTGVAGGAADRLDTIPTAADNADAVWDEPLADHDDSGSTGEALGAAGSAGDPWTTALPGSYSSGQAGKIVGDNLNATVSSRSSHSAADVWAVGTRTLTAATNISAGIATAVWAEGTRTLTAATNITTAIAAAVWEVATSGLTTVGSIGKLLVDNVNATISSRSSHAAADVWSVATRVLTAGTNLSIPSAADITTAVWAAASRTLTAATNLSIPSASDVATAVWAAGTRTLTSVSGLGIATAAKLLAYVQSLARKDVTADSDIGGNYSAATDSQEAIRDRGDAAWTSGSGGGGSVVYSPVLTEILPRFQKFNATLYVGDTGPVTLAVYDANHDPADLTDYSDMTLYIEDVRQGDVQTVAMADLTIAGSDNSMLTFTPSSTTVQSARTLKAALRKDSNGLVIVAGEFKVEYQPKA